MSLSNKKFLVSGCGFSWSGQELKTWINVLRTVGADIVDVGGPAVSNQWIINRAFQQLLTDQFDHVVIQLTSLGKLDVEINAERQHLVDNDSLRNFVVDGIWPSSHSQEHPAKALYNEFLYSPRLETEDLFCKLLMLENWCKTHQTQLTILQAYQIPWSNDQQEKLNHVVSYIDNPMSNQYRASDFYKNHNNTNSNTVPCIGYQCDLALTIAKTLLPEAVEKIVKIQHHLAKS